THRQRSGVSRKTHQRIRWAYAASCSPLTTSTTSSRACAPMALSSSAKSPSTRTYTGSVSSVALRASFSGLQRNSVNGENFTSENPSRQAITHAQDLLSYAYILSPARIETISSSLLRRSFAQEPSSLYPGKK